MTSAPSAFERAAEILGTAGLLTVVHDGLDQEGLRALYERFNAGRGPRAVTLNKEALCTAIVRLALSDTSPMEQLGKEITRVSSREVGLVGSLAEADLRARILSMPALELRRARARVLWALAADEREQARSVAGEMVEALNRAIGEVQSITERVSEPESLRRVVEDVEKKARAVERQQEGMQSRLSRLEKERAEALAHLGAKEAQLREEVAQRAELEREAALANARVRELETALDESRAEVARLRDELRTTSVDRAADARWEALQERLKHVAAERDAVQAQLSELKMRESRMLDEQRSLAGALVARDQVAQERIRRLRETLRDVRKQRTRVTQEGAESAGAVNVERVAVHVDVANIAAGATRHAGRKVDFVGLLGRLGAGRQVARAVAYVVEQGEPERFSSFCAALREAGMDVRVKKPVTRADGSTKADWDMGLAMDVVEDHARVDTVVLCSGDGDFVPLVQLMRRRGKRMEVAAFRADTHDELIRSAHEFHALGDEVLL